MQTKMSSREISTSTEGARLRGSGARAPSSFDDRGAARSVRARHSIVRARLAAAGVLTGAALAMGALLGIAFGPVAIGMYALTLPVALCLLWASADVLRADEEPRVHE